MFNFDELTDKAKTQSASSRRKGSHLPDIHVHNHFGDMANILPSTHCNPESSRPQSNTSDTSSSSKRKHDCVPESDDESDLDPIQIDDVLQSLDNSMPMFNFPQYREHLLSNGICYGRSITDFNQSYYVDKVGMSDGAAVEFVWSANRMLAKQKKEKARKKMRVNGKEN